jgi:hypothetical protein
VTQYLKQSIPKSLDSLLSNDSKTLKLFEVQLIGGTCFLCKFQRFDNLISHFSDVHSVSIAKSIDNLQCLCCCQSFNTRFKLVLHQYVVHKIVTFASLNKVYSVAFVDINENYNFENSIKKSNARLVINTSNNVSSSSSDLSQNGTKTSVNEKNKASLPSPPPPPSSSPKHKVEEKKNVKLAEEVTKRKSKRTIRNLVPLVYKN